MSEEQIIEVLKSCSHFFTNNDMILDVVRWLGWGILTLLNSLASIGINFYKACYDIIDFTSSTGLNELFTSARPLIIALMVAALVFLGLMISLGKVQKSDVYIRNFLILIIFFTCAGSIFTWANKFSTDFRDAVIEDYVDDGSNILSNYLYDLCYVDKQVGTFKGLTPKLIKQNTYSSLTEEDISIIRINEVINYKKEGLSDTAREVFGKRLVYGTPLELKDVYNGFGWNTADSEDFLNKFYYRYTFDFFPALLALSAYIIVVFGVSYKALRVIIDIVYARVILTVKATNIGGGEKAAEAINATVSLYFTLMITALTIRFYQLLCKFINQKNTDSSLITSIIIFFIAIILFSGANIVSQLLGVNPGGDKGGGLLTMLMLTGRRSGRSLTKTISSAGKRFFSGGGSPSGGGTPRSSTPGSSTPRSSTPGSGSSGSSPSGSSTPGSGIPGSGPSGSGTPGSGPSGSGTPGSGPSGSSPSGSSTPGSSPPGGGTPGSSTPGSGTPGSSTPGSGTPGSGTPGSSTPGSSTPGSGPSGSSTPGSSTPGSGPSGSGTPGSGTTGSGTPGSGTPGSSPSGNSSSGSGSSGGSTPGSKGNRTRGYNRNQKQETMKEKMKKAGTNKRSSDKGKADKGNEKKEPMPKYKGESR